MPFGVSGSAPEPRAPTAPCTRATRASAARSAASPAPCPPRHHIADQPLAPRPILARHHHGLRTPACRAAPPRSRPARSGSRGSSPGVGAAQKLQHAVRSPARQIAGAVHPAARQSQAGRPQTAPPSAPAAQIAPRKTRTPDVKLARNPRRNRLKPAIQHVDPRVPDRPPDRHFARAVVAARPLGDSDRGFGRAVQVLQLRLRRHARPDPPAPPTTPRRCRSAAGCWSRRAAVVLVNAFSIEGTKCNVVTP